MTRVSLQLSPSALMLRANRSAEGSMCGRVVPRSLCSSRSKKRAPGMWPARYSAAASRPLAGRYQEPSSTWRPGEPSRAASQEVETRGESGGEGLLEDIVGGRTASSSVAVEEGSGLLQIVGVKVPGSQPATALQCQLEEVGSGARLAAVMKTDDSCPVEQRRIGRSQQVVRRAEGARLVQDAGSKGDGCRVPAGMDRVGGAQLEMAAGPHLGKEGAQVVMPFLRCRLADSEPVGERAVLTVERG